jgi:hypothetical protein
MICSPKKNKQNQMKIMKIKTTLIHCVVILTLAAGQAATGQAVLSGTNYTQNFNTISNGLPPGWSVRTNATAASLGAAAAFNTSAVSWGVQAGQFANCAGPIANNGTNYNGGESATIQGNCTNRCPAIRQTASFGDPGAAFVFQIANTAGFSNLAFSVDLNLLHTNGYSTTWTIDYAVGNAPASFTPLGTHFNPGFFCATNRSFTLGTDADNQTDNVWIRVVALNPASGSGSRETFGIDNFVLNYSAATATTAAIPLFIQGGGQNAMLTWNDSSFALQAAPTPSGVFTNVTGATSPFTNALDAPAKFFRLIR